jgi:hypothetical protein
VLSQNEGRRIAAVMGAARSAILLNHAKRDPAAGKRFFRKALARICAIARTLAKCCDFLRQCCFSVSDCWRSPGGLALRHHRCLLSFRTRM